MLTTVKAIRAPGCFNSYVNDGVVSAKEFEKGRFNVLQKMAEAARK